MTLLGLLELPRSLHVQGDVRVLVAAAPAEGTQSDGNASGKQCRDCNEDERKEPTR